MNIIDNGLSFGSMNWNNNPAIIIVHHLEAEGPTWNVEAIHRMHKEDNGWAGIGYHYYIRLDGTVYKGRPDGAIGSHCKGANTNSLGVSFEGNYDTRGTMPSAQFNAWCELKAYLCNMYGFLPVFGHREKGSSECPGSQFPLDAVKAAQQTSTTVLGWNEDSKGWWYCTDLANGYYYANVWKEINGEWYDFDENGYAKSNNWILAGDGKWYWVRENCSMAKSMWLWIDSSCYCFGPDGALYVDCTTPDGYKVNKDGAWIR